ncbi:MAG TPA: flagellar protein FlaG [Nevskiaceae bacterium]|nr:flagellar protein FlaG [Nevskiaceae bacterium]
MSTPVSEMTPVLAAATTSTKRGDASPRDLSLPTTKTQATNADAQGAGAAPAPDNAALQKAVDELNRHFASIRTDLRFSVEKDLNVIVVAVVDSKDGTVLRQIPSEEALRIARVLAEQRSGANLVEAVA